MRKVLLRAFYDNTYFPLLTGHIESYRYGYPGVDHDAVCEVTIADGMKILAQQAFPTSYIRETETPAVRVQAALFAAGVGASYQSITNVATTALAPVSYSGTETTQAKSATLTNLSASVTVADTSGLVPGMTVAGPGVPQDATIQSIDSATAFTMTKTAFLSRSKTLRGNPNSRVLEDIQDANELSIGMAIGPYLNSNSQQIFGTASPWKAVITAIDASSITIDPPTRNVTFWDGSSPTSATGAYINACPFDAPSSATLTLPKKYIQVQGILEHLKQIEATERGTLLILGDGIYQYQGSGYRATQTVQLTFGEQGTEVPYMDAPIVNDDTNLTNEYILNNVYNETKTTITDATSQARYFRRSQLVDQIFFANTTSLPTDQRAFEPIPRMEGLIPQPAFNPLTIWPKLLGLDVSKKVSVRRRPMGAGGSLPESLSFTLGGDDIFSAYDQFIEGIVHDGDPTDWKMQFVTSPVRT